MMIRALVVVLQANSKVQLGLFGPCPRPGLARNYEDFEWPSFWWTNTQSLLDPSQTPGEENMNVKRKKIDWHHLFRFEPTRILWEKSVSYWIITYNSGLMNCSLLLLNNLPEQTHGQLNPIGTKHGQIQNRRPPLDQSLNLQWLSGVWTWSWQALDQKLKLLKHIRVLL